MAWHFVKLKFRVTGRLVGVGSPWSTIGLVFVWASALSVGLGGGILVAAAARLLDGGRVMAILVGTIVQVTWILVPVVTSALDSTVNPRWFELLPLTSGQLGRGLLAAGAIGPGGLASVLVVGIGFGVGYWPGWWGIVTVPLCALLLTLIGAVSGRLVTALLSDLLSRVNASALAPLFGLGMAALVLSLTSIAGDPTSQSVGLVPGWLDWLGLIPGGAVGLGAAVLADGPVWLAAVALAWAAVAAIGLTYAHGWAVERMQTRSVTTRRARPRGTANGTLGDRLARLIPADAVRVAAAKEACYLRRDPRLRAQATGAVVTIIVLGFLGVTLIPAAYAPFLAVAVSWATVTTLVPNQFGVDAGSFWAYVVGPTNVATALAGKNVMWSVVAGPLALVAAVAGCVVARSARYLVAALLLSVAVALVWMAVGNMTSIYGAFPSPERQVFSSGPQGGRAIIVSLAGLTASGALTLPILVGLAVAIYFGGAPAATAVAAGAVLYAMVLFQIGFRWAKTAVVERQLQLIESLDQA